VDEMPIYSVLYGSEISGKHDGHFSIRHALINAAAGVGSDGASIPSPANIIAKLQSNSLHNTKPNAVMVLYGIGNVGGDLPATAQVYS
jgi:hypothetical protein